MHLAARVLIVAFLPSIAAAQADARIPTTVTQQATTGPSSSPTAAPGTAEPGEHASRATAARVLVLDCPAAGASAAGVAPAGPSGADSLGTASLVAALCARAAADRIAAIAAQPRPHAHPRNEPRDEPRHESEPAAPTLPVEPQLTVHLFGDLKFSAIDSVGSKNGFALGQFDLFAGSRLSENLSVLTEVTLTALPRNTFSTRLERLLLTFAPSNHFSAAIGRFHTGIGYYNTAYHHGTWFQTAVGRPLVFSTDGDMGVIPSHTLGVTATGEIPSGQLGLHYLAEVGSGRAGQSSAAIAPQPAINENNTPSVNLGLFVRPDRVDGLQVGVTLYRDRLTLSDTSKAPIAETIVATHALYKTDAVELLSEALVFRRQARNGSAAVTSRGYYAQASRRFGDLRPYVRMDFLDVPREDQLMGFLGRRGGPTVGVRYDFDALAAVKLQASQLTQSARRTARRIDAQVSFMF
ncbi:MAG: hypothetical protein ABIP93_15545 [Gemmatimonadaceae bacterium]